MKKLMILAVSLVLSVSFLNAQLVSNDGGFSINSDWKDYISGVIKSNSGDITYHTDIWANTVTFKDAANTIISTSTLPSYLQTAFGINSMDFSQSFVDTDDAFESIIHYQIAEPPYTSFIKVFDANGTELLVFENGESIRKLTSNNQNYLVAEAGPNKYMVAVNGTPDVYLGDTLITVLESHVVNHDSITTYDSVHVVNEVTHSFDTTITNVFDTTFTFEHHTEVVNVNYDSITVTTEETINHLVEATQLLISVDDFEDPTLSSLEVSNPNSMINVYPNPTTESAGLNILVEEGFEGGFSYSLVDINGTQVSNYTSDLVPGETIHIDLYNLSAGVYIINFTNPNGLTLSKRIIVQ